MRTHIYWKTYEEYLAWSYGGLPRKPPVELLYGVVPRKPPVDIFFA